MGVSPNLFDVSAHMNLGYRKTREDHERGIFFLWIICQTPGGMGIWLVVRYVLSPLQDWPPWIARLTYNLDNSGLLRICGAP